MSEKTNHAFLHGLMFFDHSESLRERVGDYIENTLGSRFDGTSREAPVLQGEPEELVWYRVPLEEGLSGDGSEYHIYLKKGRTNDLCIFFSGGGVAWNEDMAAHPVTGAAVAAGQPNYYWNNLRPFTQIMNINIGITQNDTSRNPFAEWNFIVVTYATGDFHVGDNTFEYKAEDGSTQQLHFHGKRNFLASMKAAKQFFPEPDRMLIAGDSAGGFAVPAHAGTIAEFYYPECKDITLLSDSSLLPSKTWKKTARDVWKCDEPLWQALHTDDITMDWYEDLFKRSGRRFKVLYACSTHDYLLSTYYNYTLKGKYKTDRGIQKAFYHRLVKMAARMMEMDPNCGFFINDWKNILFIKGGTVHTAVRELYYNLPMKNNRSMAEWLYDAVCGKVYSVGTELLLKD